MLLRPCLVLFLLLSLVTGILYPALVTLIGHSIFPKQAEGSLIRDPAGVRGSELIGQSFSEPKYFWSRPSATGPVANNANASGGSNLGPLNPLMLDTVAARIALLRAADPHARGPIPADLVTASGSGLDPHLTPAAVRFQIDRVAEVRHLDHATVAAVVEAHIIGRQFGILGEPRVNVLTLNLALDNLTIAR